MEEGQEQPEHQQQQQKQRHDPEKEKDANPDKGGRKIRNKEKHHHLKDIEQQSFYSQMMTEVVFHYFLSFGF